MMKNIGRVLFKKGGNMYEKLLEEMEERLKDDKRNSGIAEILDIIIKIKTIQYMDLQTEFLQAGRQVSRN